MAYEQNRPSGWQPDSGDWGGAVFILMLLLGCAAIAGLVKRACDREAEGIRGEVEYRTLEQESDNVDE